MTSHFPRTAVLLFLLSMACFTPVLFAQSKPDADPAEIGFELNLDKLTQNKLGSFLEEMKDVPFREGPQSIIANAKRISGSVSLPENVQAIANVGPGSPFPVNFYLRMEFRASDAADKIWAGMQEDGFAPTPDGGDKWLKPTRGGPDDIAVYRADANTIEVGTDQYLQKSNRKFNSMGVEKLLGASQHAARVAIDLSEAEDLVKSFVEFANEQMPPQAQGQLKPFLDQIPLISSLNLAVDMSDARMLSLAVDGRNVAATQELFSTIDGLLNMAKMGVGMQLEQIKKESPKMGGLVQTVMNSLKTGKSDTAVTVNLARPEGFDAAVAEAIEKSREAALRVSQMNRFRQAALSVHNYFDSNRQFPFAPPDQSGESADISWRVRVLPYVEEMGLADKISLKEGWNSTKNKAFHNQMPKIYGQESDSLSDISAIKLEEPVSGFGDITDGTSNTIMFLQNKTGAPWMKPDDLTVDQAVALLGKLGDGESLVAVFFDGSVRTVSKDEDPEAFRSMLLPNDGK